MAQRQAGIVVLGNDNALVQSYSIHALSARSLYRRVNLFFKLLLNSTVKVQCLYDAERMRAID